ncbi:RluA family pseudouridine synthase [Methylobacterium platani]|uniref:Ribosomal large subunit pseudouridine synthase D n=2 Tax=Methylobacterium platani TaxID=427683 RepID=A0A179S557_9HYPH|nr:RluA family pseudouridine synthase [Methylobacterium platani]KMO17122.1 pseudouridine synthase [Methylobacterium platani JCM 14648]OAS21481.1 pseudouridine synthase [Methylobacterium platani]
MTKPPHRGGSGRSRTGSGGSASSRPPRVRTGPRNTARDAAERAAGLVVSNRAAPGRSGAGKSGSGKWALATPAPGNATPARPAFGRDTSDASPWERDEAPARTPAGSASKSGFGKPGFDKPRSEKPRSDRPRTGAAADRAPRSAPEDRPPARPRRQEGRDERREAGEAPHRNPPETKASSSKPPTRRALREATSEALATGVQTLEVTPDEAGMRIDRFLSARFPQLPFTRIQSLVRKGELRVNGKRAKAADRVEPGASVRVPPLSLEVRAPAPGSPRAEGDLAFLRSLILYEDQDMMVLNKPFGLAVQGGSGTTRHVDGLLEAMRDKDGQKPRLVHRLDKDTAGCLIIAKTRLAAATLAKTFRSRAARKIYWALAAGVPKVRQGRISTYLAREEVGEADSRMRVAQHGDEGASHALTYYAVVDQAGQKLAWLSLKPVTGRTHQLRAHAAHIGHPLVGDPKYFDIENWELPGGLQNRLHLLARRIVIPHPRTAKPIDVTAPLPPHMAQSWNLLGFDAARYDPIVEAPEA